MTRVTSILAGGLLWVIPGFAHHSSKAEYDLDHSMTLQGTITNVAWTNPHVHLKIDVKDAQGDLMNWDLELSSPNGLMSQGWRLDSLKPGDQVTVSGYKARDSSKNVVVVTKVVLRRQ